MTTTPPMPDRDASGYRRSPPPPGHGPAIRADIVDVYVFRCREGAKVAGDVEFLQLLRAKPPLDKTWHPVMGHIEAGETAVQCAVRELAEELGLRPAAAADEVGGQDAALRGFWALEQVHPFFIAEIDAIVLSPRFVAEVTPGWEPTLDDSHAQHRWVPRDRVERFFMWPGQLAAIREITGSLLPDGSLSRERLRVFR